MLGNTVLSGGFGNGERLLVRESHFSGSDIGALALLGFLFGTVLGMLLVVLVGIADGAVFESTTCKLAMLDRLRWLEQPWSTNPI